MTRKDTGMQGEVLKWMGHAYNKLADVAHAKQIFAQGIEFGQEHSNLRLQVDCLGGLGCLHRCGMPV